MELNRENFRAIIFYNFRRELTKHQCINDFNSIFGFEAPSRTSVYRWYGEFNRGRSSLQDEFREGLPKSAVMPETIDTVRQLILQDRHVTYREVETTLGISGTSVHSILHKQLTVKKICSRWIPHNLSITQKEARVRWSKEMLKKYDASKHVNDIVTVDESWIYAYEPETKQQLTVWVFQNEAKPTKVARARSTSKQMVACFFGKSGHVATVPLEHRRTVNSEWYTTICFGRNQENQPPKTDHSSSRQCELSHIGSNKCIFEHSKHQFDESSAVQS
jgi:histone-lysine N-methyltransferase SETMAR